MQAETTATTAASDAVTARTGAEAAQTAAETAKDAAEDALTKGPYIASSDYQWRTWNAATQSWTNTGVDARGLKGDKGDQGDPGQDGVVLELGANEYSFSIDENGYLIQIGRAHV